MTDTATDVTKANNNNSTNQTQTNITEDGGESPKPKRVVEFAGPYRLMETLGKGGLATVKVGVDLMSGVRVAVKIVDKEKLANPREQVSMAREITIMKLLRHKNILRLYDIFENEEKIFLVLDIYEGGDLYTLLTTQGALRPSEAVGLFRQLIEAVDFCHKHLIVHRDLKPENLLLSRDKKSLALSDFGLSTGMQGSRNYLKTRCGTVHYISPEVAKGEAYIGMASDVWSCGIILYAMVTASLPFDGPNSIAVLKKIVKGEYNMPNNLQPELQDLIRKMLHLDPVERITIAQIRIHPWYRFSVEKEPLESPKAEMPAEAVTLTEEDLKTNVDILDNLHLLGWEDVELAEDLLSTEMNMAKMFYKLLLQHKERENKHQQQEQNKLPKQKIHVNPNALSQSHNALLQKDRQSSTSTKQERIHIHMTPQSPSPSPSTSTSSTSTSSTSSVSTVSTASAPSTPSGSTSTLSSSTPTSTVSGGAPSTGGAEVDLLSPTSKAVKRKSGREKRVIIRKKSGKGVFDRERSSTVDGDQPNSNARQTRSATVGDGPRPAVESRAGNSSNRTLGSSTGNTASSADADSPMNLSFGRRMRWLTKPSSGEPNAKMFRLESTKNITEILFQLKHCFGDMEMDISEKQTKSGVIKVKASQSSPQASPKEGKKKRAMLKVEMISTEAGNVNIKFKKGTGAELEDFQETMKKLEENLQ